MSLNMSPKSKLSLNNIARCLYKGAINDFEKANTIMLKRILTRKDALKTSLWVKKIKFPMDNIEVNHHFAQN